MVSHVPKDLLARTAAFLLLKDSTSNYVIHGERPPPPGAGLSIRACLHEDTWHVFSSTKTVAWLRFGCSSSHVNRTSSPVERTGSAETILKQAQGKLSARPVVFGEPANPLDNSGACSNR